jgi:cellulose synthase/poly-beta-1,6-N-acetylglucosamine synthase-like glycosyltransferase
MIDPGLLLAFSLIALGVAYAVVIGDFALGFRSVTRQRGTIGPAGDGLRALPFVTVVVPVRDEEASIARCLESILACDYPEDRFEVIVVDDLSEDATPAIVRSMAKALAPLATAGSVPDDDPEPVRLRLLQMPENLERTQAHKKRAITKAVDHASGEIILTTDGDCVVPRGWIRDMATAFDDDVAMVSGPVLYPVGGTPARHVQALEFMGLVAVGAGAIGAGRPNLCNGANVAYRRDVFDALGGFSGIDHLTSGDDELLMQKIAYGTAWRVRFCASRDATVVTDGAPTLWSFFQQRRRWASKGRHYPHPPLRAKVAAIYAFYVALLAASVAGPFGAVAMPAVIAAWALKMAPEAALLGPAASHFGRVRLMAYFVLVQPVHVLYIVVMGAAGAAGGYTWKGRRIAR